MVFLAFNRVTCKQALDSSTKSSGERVARARNRNGSAGTANSFSLLPVRCFPLLLCPQFRREFHPLSTPCVALSLSLSLASPAVLSQVDNLIYLRLSNGHGARTIDIICVRTYVRAYARNNRFRNSIRWPRERGRIPGLLITRGHRELFIIFVQSSECAVPELLYKRWL